MPNASVLRPKGHIFVTDPDGNLVESDTLQCVHCGAHWQVQPGSGKIRGFCSRCNGPICGPKCLDCVPREQQLQNIEQGQPKGYRPILAGFGGRGAR